MTTATTSLSAFLLARIEEDEAVALAASEGGGAWKSGGGWEPIVMIDNGTAFGGDPVVYDEGRPSEQQATHIARHDPARVLAECKAKRAIVELHDQRGERWTGFPRADRQEDYCLHDQQSSPCPTLRVLASVYADHPDFDPRWAS